MGWFTRLASLFRRSTADMEYGWNGSPFGSATITGVDVSQQTALTATAVLAAVTMLSEDFAKLKPSIKRRHPDGSTMVAKDHELYNLLYRPNPWQNYFQWAQMMQLSLVTRENAVAVKIRDGRGKVIKLIPVNFDWVALWEAPDGGIFYHITPNGLHMMAELAGQPFLIPAEDILHVIGLSLNGLVGMSRLVLAKEAIALAIGYERHAAQYLGQGTSASGILTTDLKLTPEAANRMAADWKDKKSGLQNAGKIVVLEQGLKYQPTVFSAVDAEFIASRGLQLQEVARIWRIPPHMLADLGKSTNNNIEQQGQEYINLTMSSHTERWAWVWDVDFDLREQDLFVEYDWSILSRANQTARYANYARGISGGFLMPNEARVDDGRNPVPGGNKLLQPSNLAAAGSQSTGAGADGGGHPTKDDQNSQP